MDVSVSTAKIVFSRSGNRCAFPECAQEIAFKDFGEYANVGELTHIKGNKPTSARHDINQDKKDRNSPDNLILLCGTHHKIVDDQRELYSIEKLTKIKLDHESWVRKRCTKEISNITFDI